MKIGLFGGSFNPPHIGHLRAAKLFCEKADLDVLYVVPAFVSPFKTHVVQSVAAQDRLHMTKICFDVLKDIKTKIVVSDIEIQNNTTSYTIDTVNKLLQMHGQDKLYMLMGSDMFCSLEKWRSFDRLFEKCIIYTLSREENQKKMLSEFAQKYAEKYSANCVVCDCPAVVVSSTDIREALESENFINLQNLLTQGVLRYIIKNGIFVNVKGGKNNEILPTSKSVISQIKNDMPLYLSDKRLSHTLSVCEQALDIAGMMFDKTNIDKNYLCDIEAAALLHDFTKNLDLTAQKELCLKYGIETDEVSCDSCNLLHSKTAAYLAREKYGINDNVFYAVYNHTTGCEDMSVFEKIIFISDYIEPLRKQSVCIQARKNFYEDVKKYGCTMEVLDKAVRQCLDSTIQYLLSIGAMIDIQTIKARNYLTDIYTPV